VDFTGKWGYCQISCLPFRSRTGRLLPEVASRGSVDLGDEAGGTQGRSGSDAAGQCLRVLTSSLIAPATILDLRADFPACSHLLSRSTIVLCEKLRRIFQALPDRRQRSAAQRNEVENAALSAVSVFRSQCLSVLDSQDRTGCRRHCRGGARSCCSGCLRFPAIGRSASFWTGFPAETR